MVSVDVKQHRRSCSVQEQMPAFLHLCERGRPGVAVASFVTLALTQICLRRGTGGDRDRRRWSEGVGELYIVIHYHHLNDFCIKMGSKGNHFNVSFIVRGKVAGQCP